MNTASPVSLRISTYRYSSLVYLRNSRPVLWNLLVSAAADIEGASLRIAVSPDYCAEQRIPLPFLRAGDSYDWRGECPAFDDERLMALTEEEPGHICVEVLDQDGTVLARQEDDFKWLAYNSWAGGYEYPELLAALTLPNDPAVDRILEETKAALHRTTEWRGYNEDAAGTRACLTALWDTLAAQNIDYALPPKSWRDEGVGQRVRTPSFILEHRQSTCLDSTLLLAACTARMGYNPFVILTEGHAFLGVMTENRPLPSPQMTPAATVRNLMKQGKLLVLETTALNRDEHREPLPFGTATAAGEEKLFRLEDGDYFQALDIRKLWQECSIHPILHGDLVDVAPAPPARDEDELITEAPRTRMDNWQLKLLDLSLRNNLLNTRTDGKRQLRLLLPDVGKLEDKLAAGASFRVKSIPETYWTITSQMQHGTATAEMAERIGDCVQSMFAKNELVSLLRESELQRGLQGLYNATKREMEESGANTLYVACGFLKWYRKDAHERAYYAPLLLLPVRLTRPSVRAGFTLRGSDEETRINSTLLELLKTEFSLRIPELEGELPTDESGLDVPKIFNIVRRAVTSQPGWEVAETCTLGTFSFTKYLMWKDMTDRKAQLLQNPIVAQIAATSRSVFPEEAGFPDVRKLDNDVDAAKVFTPLSSDSSQLAAVIAAGRGKSFVLFGPPGTGKSQTITNMIAHCLAHGKKVLFVAEKAAALQVVHKRLKRIGLEDFCLELHSNKANKKAVLAQFKAAVEAISAGAKEDNWNEDTYSMADLRSRLNLLPWEMHKPYPDGGTLYEAVTLVSEHPELPDFTPCADDPLTLTRERLHELLTEAGEVALYYGTVRSLPAEKRALLAQREYSMGWEEDLFAHLTAYTRLARERHGCLAALRTQLHLPETAEEGVLCGVLPVLAACNTPAEKERALALLPSRAAETLRTLKTLLPQAEEYRRQRAELSLSYPEKTTEDPELDNLLRECRMATVSWFLPRFFALRRIGKLLQLMASDNRKPNCLRDLQALVAMREAKKALAALPADTLPELLRRGTELTAEEVAAAETTAAALSPATGETEDSAAALLRDTTGLLRTAARELAQLSELNRLLAEEQTQLARLTATDTTAHPADWAEQLLGFRAQWRDLVLWNAKLNDAAHPDVRTLAAYESRAELSAGDLKTALRTAIARRRLRAAADGIDTLKTFSGPLHEGHIRHFREADEAVMKATSAHIRSLLIRGAKTAPYGTEVALLQRELSKQRAHMPLRQLIASVPHLLTQLKPCMLMSPLSVAQYLAADTELFDIVIFDEASQIPVWDAVGAIARGRNAVIVGDPKQMPPTSFFSRSKTEEEEDSGTEQDLESILDECIACAIPQMNLTWHYRSKSENLIAFSNRNYYDQKLSTFPAPVMADNALQYHYIGGVYESGSTKRINQAEARALVAHVLDTLRAPDFRYTEATSIGIVTFNAQQQAYIEDLLEDAREADDSLEPFFSENNPEAVFVKNLENVQGDERGVIYFSTTYGPDAKGKLSMNFGPLNLAGGERRLNVAVTRARNAMHVFTSLKPEDIDLNRTQARGAADLRGFLDYARRGAESYLRLQSAGKADSTQDLADVIAARLNEKGWSCKCRVGVSDYRIDIAVESPDRAGEIMAGITLDGKAYAAAATARDRDVLRSSVLTGLGWRLIPVWSMEWWRNNEACLEKIDARLNEFRKAGPVKPAELPSLAEAMEATETESAPAPVAAKPEIAAPLVADAYAAYVPDMVLPPLFEMSDASLRPHLLALVRQEGPMKEEFLLARLRELAPLTPALTAPLKRRIGELIDKLAAQGKLFRVAEPQGTTLLSAEAALTVHPRQHGPRAWDDIPDSELLLAIDRVHAHLKCIRGCDDHLKGVATFFGIPRLTAPFKAHLNELLQAEA